MEETAVSPGRAGFVKPSFRPLVAKSRIWGLSADDVNQLRSNERRVLPDLLRIFLANRTSPPTLWGPPGSRKTRTIESYARETDENGTPYQVITVQPSTEDPTVIHGMMYTTLDSRSGETVMRRSIPDIAQQVVNYWNEHQGLTILFLDEMTTCMPAQQHALLGILTHGKYGDISIQDYISVVMAANPENTVSTVHPLGEQVINRGAHLPWYGDMGLFLEEWRTGFNHAIPAPDPLSNWYMTSLMMESPDDVFRNRQNWEPDQLVPYELFENSERSMTEWNNVVRMVNELFSDAKDEIRHYYLVQVTRAMLGPEWSDRMSIVCAKEKDLVSADSIVGLVEQVGVSPDWDLDRLKGNLSGKLYVTADGKQLRQDQVQSIAIELVDRISKSHDIDACMALWSLVALAPTSGDSAGLHQHVVSMFSSAYIRYVRGEIDAGQLKSVSGPAFVPDTIRDNIRPAIGRAKDAIDTSMGRGSRNVPGAQG